MSYSRSVRNGRLRAGLALALAAFAGLFIHASCGSEPNPILGVWDVTVKTGNAAADTAVNLFAAIQKPSVTFTETEMVVEGVGPVSGSRQVSYTRDDNGRWMACFGEGSGECHLVSFQDEAGTRATFHFMGIEMNLSKRPPAAKPS
jgi:hypothetical protein